MARLPFELFLCPYEILPIAQANKHWRIFSYFIMKLYDACTHQNRLIEAILISTPITHNYCVENQIDFPKFSQFASWPGDMINPQWLELPISRTNFLCSRRCLSHWSSTEHILYCKMYLLNFSTSFLNIFSHVMDYMAIDERGMWRFLISKQNMCFYRRIRKLSNVLSWKQFILCGYSYKVYFSRIRKFLNCRYSLAKRCHHKKN